jgi:uncharacterized protein YgbK (DUF1537 family)
MKLAVIADDFTGANDTGVQFAKKGMKTVVTTNINQISTLIPEYEVVVFDTESRFDAREISYNKVKNIAEKIKGVGTKLVYKKIDSTFRGNIGSEISGCMDGCKSDFAILIPALPSNGRTTVGSHAIVHGKRLDETEVAYDPKTPVKKSFIPDIIQDQSSKKIKTITKASIEFKPETILEAINKCRDNGAQIVVIDSATEEDLRMLASVLPDIGDNVLLVGTAGLAEYLSDAFKLQCKKAVLAILGSVSDITRKQIEYAQEHNKIKICDFFVQTMFDNKKRNNFVEEVISNLKQGEDIAIRTAKDKQTVQDAIEFAKKKGMPGTDISEYIAQSLGQVTGQILNEASHYLSGVFITGGDTLIKIANVLKIEGMVISEEVLPAIPLGKFIHNKYNDINIITKAGAFGSEDAFSNILNYLRC